MARLKIKFHPLFLIYVFLCIYFGWFNSIFYYVVAVTLHEYGHYFFAKHYGYNVDKMIFSLYGAGLYSNNSYKIKHDIIISLAGPLVNLILIIITISLWWIFPTLYMFTYDFMICNLVIMLFNLIPIYPLDGGRVLVALSTKKINRKKVVKIHQIVCFGLGLLFLILFLVSIFYKINYNLLFIGLFLAMNSITHDNYEYFDKMRKLNKNINKPLEVKVFRINNLNKKELLNTLSPHYYSVFEYVKDDKVIRFNEDEILK